MIKKKYVFVLFLTLILSVACAGEQGPREAAINLSNQPTSSKTADYLSLMPAETNILFYANLSSLKQTPFGEAISERIEDEIREEREDREYREFVRETGLDPQRDIYEVMFGGNGLKRHDDMGGAIIRGKFNEKRIVNYLKEERHHRFRERAYRGHRIYLLLDYHHDDDDNEFTFLSSETVAFGDREWLKDVIDLSEDDGKNVKGNAVMTQFLNEIPNKDQLWGIMNLDEITGDWAGEIRERGSAFKGTESIENMKSLIFHSEVDKKAKLYVMGNFATAEEAELLAEMLNGFKAMAKLMVSDDKETIDMLNDIKIRSNGSVLRITTTVDKDIIDKMEEKSKKYRDRGVKLL